jgi:hypothetical protein
MEENREITGAGFRFYPYTLPEVRMLLLPGEA